MPSAAAQTIAETIAAAARRAWWTEARRVGEIWARYGRDVGEIWARYGRDMGEAHLVDGGAQDADLRRLLLELRLVRGSG